MRLIIKNIGISDQLKMKEIIQSKTLSVDEITIKLLHMKPCSDVLNYHNRLQFLESATSLWDTRGNSDFTKQCESIAEHIRAIQMKLGAVSPRPANLKIGNGRKIKKKKK